jgi:hypothetical protein
MDKKLKSIIKKFLPARFINFIYNIKPDIFLINTYLLKQNELISNLYRIDDRFSIKVLTPKDADALKDLYGNDKNISPRLLSDAWVGLAVFDRITNNIAYVSWIITKKTEFIAEFGIELKNNQFWLRHGYCNPKYRHQGLHTRMEQERINYCIDHGADEIYIQISRNNNKGHNSVTNNGFVFFKRNYIIRIPLLNIHRELFSFIKAPFRKVI